MLSDDELLRYSRQIMLPDIDVLGQEKLLQAKVLIVGLGGLGSPVVMYLATAGVGNLVLVDDDSVELSNLQRQIAHTTDNLNETKVLSAKKAVKALNPNIAVETIAKRLNSLELDGLVQQADVVVDCTDNFDTRLMINRSCVINKKVLVSGAAIRMEGQLLTVDPTIDGSPCYQCLYPEVNNEELTCSNSGVLAPLVGVIGSMQALEVIKVITGVGEALVGRVLLFDAKIMQWQALKLKADKQCKVCSGVA